MGPGCGLQGIHTPQSRGAERSLHPSPRFCTFATRPSCAWGGKRWRRETGPSLVRAAGRSRFLAPLVAGLAERCGRGPTPPLYKEGEGGMSSRTLLSSISSCFCFFLSLAMEKGNPGPSTVAARVAARQRAPPPPEPVVVEPAARGRGGGEAVGEAGAEVVVLGEEEDGAARRLRPRQ